MVKSVRVDISELSLVPSISMQSSNHDFSVLVLCTQVNMMFMMFTLSVYPHGDLCCNDIFHDHATFVNLIIGNLTLLSPCG